MKEEFEQLINRLTEEERALLLAAALELLREH